MDTDNYFDLTNTSNNIEDLAISSDDYYNCSLINTQTGEVYCGFVLAKSPAGNRLTVCDVNFHRSRTDGKYQPRLTFRRADQSFQDVSPPITSRHTRIPFATGEDGYREFWTMVFFLYGFKETIDFGDFDGQYQIISNEQLKDYLNNKENYEKITQLAEDLNTDILSVLRSSTTLKLLREYRLRLQDFINNNRSETDVQNWIDEDDHKHRQQRCMIFGLEYIDFKREGSISSKRFDVLTRVGSKYIDHVLIELKSPSDDIFEVHTSQTINNQTNEYRIHKELSRAIPQILEYKSSLESKQPGDAELEKLGIKQTPHIGKCIIVIGKHKDDPRWLKNRENLVRSLNSSLEIWTYTELLNKLTATIENLEAASVSTGAQSTF